MYCILLRLESKGSPILFSILKAAAFTGNGGVLFLQHVAMQTQGDINKMNTLTFTFLKGHVIFFMLSCRI